MNLESSLIDQRERANTLRAVARVGSRPCLVERAGRPITGKLGIALSDDQCDLVDWREVYVGGVTS